MLTIGIIIGSTRPNRLGETISNWVYDYAKKREDAVYELIDLRDWHLPFLDEPFPGAMGNYANQHTKDWAAKIDSLDAFIFVTPEYNRSVPGSLKNAIDYVYKEWHHKVAGFVGYSGTGIIRAIDHLRIVMSELRVATVRDQVEINCRLSFKDFINFAPTQQHEETLQAMIDNVVLWGNAFKQIKH